MLILVEGWKKKEGGNRQKADQQLVMMVSEMISTRTLQPPSQEQMAAAHDLLNGTPGVGCKNSDVTVLKELVLT